MNFATVGILCTSAVKWYDAKHNNSSITRQMFSRVTEFIANWSKELLVTEWFRSQSGQFLTPESFATKPHYIKSYKFLTIKGFIMTLNGVSVIALTRILRYFIEFDSFAGLAEFVFHFWPQLTHHAARSLCDSWATCLLLHWLIDFLLLKYDWLIDWLTDWLLAS